MLTNLTRFAIYFTLKAILVLIKMGPVNNSNILLPFSIKRKITDIKQHFSLE